MVGSWIYSLTCTVYWRWLGNRIASIYSWCTHCGWWNDGLCQDWKYSICCRRPHCWILVPLGWLSYPKPPVLWCWVCLFDPPRMSNHLPLFQSLHCSLQARSSRVCRSCRLFYPKSNSQSKASARGFELTRLVRTVHLRQCIQSAKVKTGCQARRVPKLIKFGVMLYFNNENISKAFHGRFVMMFKLSWVVDMVSSTKYRH